MSKVSQTSLPGVGVRYDYQTKAGDQVGVIVHHTDHYDFVIYDKDDPDSCSSMLSLDSDDAHTLTELLGGSQVAESQQNMKQSVAGLIIDWVPVHGDWACSGQSIREIGVRAATGATIVAIIRDEETFASPEPDFKILAGDTALVIGTQEQVTKAYDLLHGV